MAFFLILSLLLVQTPAPAVSVDEKSQAIIDHAITALGGPKYLGVQTAIGKGFFTSFKDGMTQLPSRFLDYIRYPDNERTEFNSNGIRAIQTNTGDTGWVYDGGPKKMEPSGATSASDHALNFPRSSAGTPIISAMTMTGSG